jgi:DNA-binding NtrC family response regulator
MTDKDRVLIVDDNHIVLESLVNLLESWNFETAQAMNIEEALKEVKNNSFSAVLLDIKLGDENGLDLLKSIRALNIKIPVIVMTAYPHDYDWNNFFDLDAVAFLVKPILPANLKNVLTYSVQKKPEKERGKKP